MVPRVVGKAGVLPQDDDAMSGKNETKKGKKTQPAARGWGGPPFEIKENFLWKNECFSGHESKRWQGCQLRRAATPQNGHIAVTVEKKGNTTFANRIVPGVTKGT